MSKRPQAPSARRAWFRRKRRKAGQKDPLPTDVGTFNAMSVSASQAKAEAIFIASLRQGAIVTKLNEMGKVRGQAVADRAFGKDYFRVIQYGAYNSPESGSALAIRLDRAEIHKDEAGVEECGLNVYSGFGRNVRPRSAPWGNVTVDPGTVHGWTQVYEAGHSPLKSTGQQGRFRKAWTRSKAAVKSGDMNTRRARIRAWASGYTVRGRGVLYIFVKRWIPCSSARHVPKSKLAGADHAGEIVTLWPNKNKTAPKWKKGSK